LENGEFESRRIFQFGKRTKFMQKLKFSKRGRFQTQTPVLMRQSEGALFGMAESAFSAVLAFALGELVAWTRLASFLDGQIAFVARAVLVSAFIAIRALATISELVALLGSS
jgi:hypothetical protein